MYREPPTYVVEPVAGRRSPRYWTCWLLASLAVGAASVVLARLASEAAGMADLLSHGYTAGLLAGALLGSYASGILEPFRPGCKRTLLAAGLRALGAASLGALLAIGAIPSTPGRVTGRSGRAAGRWMPAPRSW